MFSVRVHMCRQLPYKASCSKVIGSDCCRHLVKWMTACVEGFNFTVKRGYNTGFTIHSREEAEVKEEHVKSKKQDGGQMM